MFLLAYGPEAHHEELVAVQRLLDTVIDLANTMKLGTSLKEILRAALDELRDIELSCSEDTGIGYALLGWKNVKLDDERVFIQFDPISKRLSDSTVFNSSGENIAGHIQWAHGHWSEDHVQFANEIRALLLEQKGKWKKVPFNERTIVHRT